MLNKTVQAMYLNRELTAIRKFLVGLKTAEPGKKQIHDVRINIKKIVALSELNKIHGYQAGNLPLLGMRSLFKTTGAVRSSQLILNNLEKSGIDDKKINQLHCKIIETNTRRLVKQSPDHLKMLYALRNEMTVQKLQTLRDSEVLLYHTLKADYLHQIFRKPINPTHLHEGRKQIKHILYIRELIKAPILKKLPFHMKNLEQLQDMIGKWHDTLVYLECLQEFNTGKNQKPLKESVSREKEQFAQISSFIADKNHPIFIS